MNILLFWILLFVIMLAIDLGTSTFLFVWFSIGALAAIVAYLLNFSLAIQFMVFGVTSIIAISIGYPWAKEKLKKTTNKVPIMEENYIGMEFTAEEDIDKNFRLKVKGIYWTGENVGPKITKGEKFKIVGIDGNKLKVIREAQ